MITKRAEFTLIDIKALNKPTILPIFKDQNLSLDKNILRDTVKIVTASQKSAELEVDGDSTYFDLEAEINSHPDSLFVKCFAIKADETNDNGDYFGRGQLKIATPTFVGVPVFTNHKNDDINEARGKVVHSWWDDSKNGIMIIARVDAEAYPQLARGIKEQYILGTSMGCQVKYSLCSICHAYAESPDQYCEHVRERKTRTLSAKNQKCAYHKHGTEDICPICQSTKNEKRTYAVVDQKVFEYNYGIKFIENSFVVNPACSDCGVTEVIDPQTFLAKVAVIQEELPRLMKVAMDTPLSCTDQTCIKIANQDHMNILSKAIDFLSKGTVHLFKEAGQPELDNLQQALDLITSVSQAMLSQKDQIDLEFLSDLVKVLSDLQTVLDELTEQGYGRLPSPAQQDQTQAPQQDATQQPVPPQTQAVSPRVQSGPAGAAGTVTSPIANKTINLEKIANLIKKSKKLNLENTLNITPSLDLELQMKSQKKLDL